MSQPAGDDYEAGTSGYQLLSPAGERTSETRGTALIDPLTPGELTDWYRDMALTRRFDTEMTALQRQGQLGLWVPSLGQEATQVGPGRALRQQDYVVPGYRDHGVLRTRGVPLERLVPLFRGTSHGGWDPAEYRCHLYTLVVGSQALHATGYALGIQHDGLCGTGDEEKDEAVAVYFGDGASSQGDVNEALIFAAAAGAPVVFLCVNNGWAISEPTSRQSRTPLAARAAGFGLTAERVDGNDVLATYVAARTALDRARAGQGPQFLELITYRLGAHTTSDDPTRYRSKDEEASWRGRDPLTRFAAYLKALGVDDDAFAGIEQEADQLAAQVRAFTLSLSDGELMNHFEHVYGTANQTIERERAEFAATQLAAPGGAL